MALCLRYVPVLIEFHPHTLAFLFFPNDFKQVASARFSKVIIFLGNSQSFYKLACGVT